jgi:hypothetical protein
MIFNTESSEALDRARGAKRRTGAERGKDNNAME